MISYRFLWGCLAITIAISTILLPLPTLLTLMLIVAIALTIATLPMAIFIFLLVLAPLRTLIATESVITFPLDIGQFLFGLSLFIYTLYTLNQNRRLIPAFSNSFLYIPIGIFITISGITIMNASHVGFWLSEWLKWILILLTIMIVLNSKYPWQFWIHALLASAVGNAIIGLYIFFGGSGADHLLINDRFFRAFGTFGQPNPFGGFMGLMLPLAGAMFYGELAATYNQWKRTSTIKYDTIAQLTLLLLICLILATALIASWSRGAWLGFIVAVGVMIFSLPDKLWKSVLLILCGSFCLFGLWFSGVVPDSINQRITSSTEDLFLISDVRGVDITAANYAVVERIAHWQAALNMTYDNPWLGVGFGNYEVEYSDYQLMNWNEPLGHAHNYYLNILSETGIIGFLAYCSMWLYIIWVTWKMRNHPDIKIKMIVIGLLGSWTYLSVHSLLDNLYVNNLFVHLGVMLGVLATLHEHVSQSLWWE